MSSSPAFFQCLARKALRGFGFHEQSFKKARTARHTSAQPTVEDKARRAGPGVFGVQPIRELRGAGVPGGRAPCGGHQTNANRVTTRSQQTSLEASGQNCGKLWKICGKIAEDMMLGMYTFWRRRTKTSHLFKFATLRCTLRHCPHIIRQKFSCTFGNILTPNWAKKR